MNKLYNIKKALGSQHEETRRGALQALRGRPLTETRNLLLSSMGDESWRVRKEAVDVFVSANPDENTIEALLELLRNQDNAGLRNSAAEAVARIGTRAANALIRLLKDDDEDVRKFVIDVMGLIDSTEFLPVLLSSLGDPDVNVASAAAEHLGNIGDARTVPDLINAIIANDSVLFRFSALAALGKLTSHVPVPAEIIKLAEQDILRKGVYDCLGSIGDESVIPILLRGFQSIQKSSRISAIKSLYRIFSRSSGNARQSIEKSLRQLSRTEMVTALVEVFNVNEPVLAEAITVILGIIGDVRGAAVLLTAFSSERLSGIALTSLKRFGINGMHALVALYPDVAETARCAICTVVGELLYRDGGGLICDALHDSSPLVRMAAVSAAGKLGLIECIPDMVSLLDDADIEIRNSVIECLQVLAIIDRNVIQEVAFRLEESVQPEQRRDAAILLAALGDGERLFHHLVKDEDANVRQAAVASIGKLHISEARGILLIALVDESPDVRIAAIEALGEMGDSELFEPLLHALNDDDSWVQCAALKSIARINPSRILAAVQSVYPEAAGLLLITCLDLLENLGSDEALTLVEEALLKRDEEVVKLAIEILMRTGRDRVELHAEHLMSHPHRDVRAACARALAALSTQRAKHILSAALEWEENDLVKTEIKSLLEGIA
jgi:HEAT repeat protein